MGGKGQQLAEMIREAREGGREWHQCKDCDKWYGAEDDEYGPCLYKHARGDKRFITYGSHQCDEPEELKSRGLM
ncbi:MAG: hypothetical protein LN412_00735 [Candidatus Thermoplasmatota archaeon]|nr:hypothetical protein [Candidatus Thermoplasmatota archaeon]